MGVEIPHIKYEEDSLTAEYGFLEPIQLLIRQY